MELWGPLQVAKTTLHILHGPLWFCFTAVSGVIANRPYWLLIGAAHLVPTVAKMSEMSTFLLKSFEPPHPAPSLLSRSKPSSFVAMGSTSAYRAAARFFFCRSRCGIILKDLFGLNLDWFSPRSSAIWHFFCEENQQFWSPKCFPHQRIVFFCIFPGNKQRTHPPCSLEESFRGLTRIWKLMARNIDQNASFAKTDVLRRFVHSSYWDVHDT